MSSETSDEPKPSLSVMEGKGFYNKNAAIPAADLAWSSYAAVWLSQIPCQIPDHFFTPCSTGAVRAEFERQAAPTRIDHLVGMIVLAKQGAG